MRKNVQKVLGCWRMRQRCVGDSRNSISTDGETIFSYREPIVWRDRAENVYVLVSSAWSVTTRMQVAHLFHELRHAARCVDSHEDMHKLIGGNRRVAFPCDQLDARRAAEKARLKAEAKRRVEAKRRLAARQKPLLGLGGAARRRYA